MRRFGRVAEMVLAGAAVIALGADGLGQPAGSQAAGSTMDQRLAQVISLLQGSPTPHTAQGAVEHALEILYGGMRPLPSKGEALAQTQQADNAIRAAETRLAAALGAYARRSGDAPAQRMAVDVKLFIEQMDEVARAVGEVTRQCGLGDSIDQAPCDQLKPLLDEETGDERPVGGPGVTTTTSPSATTTTTTTPTTTTSTSTTSTSTSTSTSTTTSTTSTTTTRTTTPTTAPTITTPTTVGATTIPPNASTTLPFNTLPPFVPTIPTTNPTTASSTTTTRQPFAAAALSPPSPSVIAPSYRVKLRSPFVPPFFTGFEEDVHVTKAIAPGHCAVVFKEVRGLMIKLHFDSVIVVSDPWVATFGVPRGTRIPIWKLEFVPSEFTKTFNLCNTNGSIEQSVTMRVVQDVPLTYFWRFYQKN